MTVSRPGAARPVTAAKPAASAQPPAPPKGPVAWGLRETHDAMAKHPALNDFVAPVSGPLVKRMFNLPDKPGDAGPAPLKAETIEQARALMAERFKPEAGKVVVGIAGGGKETVHTFVVSGVRPDGKVEISQAIAQYGDVPEDYSGVGGRVRQAMDKLLRNEPKRMKGVVTEEWTEYAARSKRNSIVLMELDADPAKIREALGELKGLVGKPYDPTMLGAVVATPASEQGMYCTEVSSWFINKLKPGTIQQSYVSGYPLFQVADHLRATDVNGGPLKVFYNGENRLDIAHADPIPKQR